MNTGSIIVLVLVLLFVVYQIISTTLMIIKKRKEAKQKKDADALTPTEDNIVNVSNNDINLNKEEDTDNVN